MTLETFDYTDGTSTIPGTTVYLGSFTIQSNVFTPAESTRIVWESEYDGSWSTIIDPASSDTANAGIIIRGSDIDNHLSFFFRASDGLLRGEKRVAGSGTTVFSKTVSGYASGDARTLRVDATGTAIEVYLDDVLQQGWADDSGLSGVQAGIRTDSSNYTFDDFSYPAASTTLRQVTVDLPAAVVGESGYNYTLHNLSTMEQVDFGVLDTSSTPVTIQFDNTGVSSAATLTFFASNIDASNDNTATVVWDKADVSLVGA